jgi:hypothetical protein
MSWRLAEGDSFLEEIVSKGTVLYEAPDGGVGEKSRGRLSRRKPTRARKAPCQQSAVCGKIPSRRY